MLLKKHQEMPCAIGTTNRCPPFKAFQVAVLRNARSTSHLFSTDVLSLRGINPAFIRSIVGHETYPGHHLQSVHHVLGTPKDSFLREVFWPIDGNSIELPERFTPESSFVKKHRQAMFDKHAAS